MRRTFLLFTVVLLFLGWISCSEKMQPDVHITGEWKLVETKGMLIVDQSVNQIYYEFKPNGTLTVENNIGEMTGIFARGNYEYEFFGREPVSWNEYTFFANIKIEDKEYGCYLAADKMVLVDNPALDGPLIYFIRL